MATMPVTGYCTFHTTREREVLRRAPGTRSPDAGPVDGTGTTLGETLVRLGSPDATSRRCTADSRHPPVSRMMLCIEPRPSLRSEDPVGIPSQGQPGPYFFVGQFVPNPKGSPAI